MILNFFAFIISWLTFFIPRKEFDSRIALNIGAIFGAIGNRYFVDASLASIQVMTKSDVINYICIILLILNISFNSNNWKVYTGQLLYSFFNERHKITKKYITHRTFIYQICYIIS